MGAPPAAPQRRRRPGMPALPLALLLVSSFVAPAAANLLGDGSVSTTGVFAGSSGHTRVTLVRALAGDSTMKCFYIHNMQRMLFHQNFNGKNCHLSTQTMQRPHINHMQHAYTRSTVRPVRIDSSAASLHMQIISFSTKSIVVKYRKPCSFRRLTCNHKQPVSDIPATKLWEWICKRVGTTLTQSVSSPPHLTDERLDPRPA